MNYCKSFNEAANAVIEKPEKEVSFIEKKLVQDVEEIDGRLVSVSRWKDCDVRDNFKDIKVNDLSIENLIASGAINSLKFNTVDGLGFDGIDKMGSSVDSLADIEVEE